MYIDMIYATRMLIFATIFLVLFVTIEFIQRRTKMKNEYSRKLAHVSSALVTVLMPYFLSRWEVVGLALFFTVFLLSTRFFGFFQSIHKVGRHTFGEVYFPLGVAVTGYFFLPNDLKAFQFGMLVLGFSDAIGGIVGYVLGNRKTKLFGEKSVEGTAAFFLCTIAIFFALVQSQNSLLVRGLIVSIAITCIELVLDGGFDNLALPVLSAMLVKVVVDL